MPNKLYKIQQNQMLSAMNQSVKQEKVAAEFSEKQPKSNRYNKLDESPQKLPVLMLKKGQNSDNSENKLAKGNHSQSNQNSKALISHKQQTSANNSISVDAQQPSPSKRKINIERHDLEIYTLVQKLVTQPGIPASFEPYYNHLNTILSKMVNWELLEEKEISLSLQTLKLILSSRISTILAEPRYIDWLIKMLDSENMPLNIQLLALEAVQSVSKNISHKKVIIQRDILKSLVKIAISCISAKEKDRYDKQLIVNAIKCLTLLGGIYDRRNYIPGETRENDQIRRILIEGGGLLALLIINKKSTEEEYRQQSKVLLDNLSQNDLEYQL